MPRIRVFAGWTSHVIAAAIALLYAGLISRTDFISTGLQFVAPVFVIMVVHLLWLALSRGLPAGFSNTIYARTAVTAIGMAVIIFAASILSPKPAVADIGDNLEVFFGAVFCIAIIAIVGGLIASIIYLFAKLLLLPFKSGDDGDGPTTRLFDLGSLALAGAALGVFSLEGVSSSYTFATDNRAQATYHIDATEAEVWSALETATSPDFPLPNMLYSFPKPTAVVVDEGTALGATRQVEFQGREGRGYLTLEVTTRTPHRAMFTVLSDTSPYANWIAHRTLTYATRETRTGTELIVSLDYDRQLSPSWFFTPTIQGAAHLAMNVLARDVKTRAEGL